MWPNARKPTCWSKNQVSLFFVLGQVNQALSCRLLGFPPTSLQNAQHEKTHQSVQKLQCKKTHLFVTERWTCILQCAATCSSPISTGYCTRLQSVEFHIDSFFIHFVHSGSTIFLFAESFSLIAHPAHSACFTSFLFSHASTLRLSEPCLLCVFVTLLPHSHPRNELFAFSKARSTRCVVRICDALSVMIRAPCVWKNFSNLSRCVIRSFVTSGLPIGW